MPEPFVTVAHYEFLPEAETVRMHLEMEGFQAMLADAETVSTDWALGNAIGYIKLQVPESQATTVFPLVEEMRTRRLANANARQVEAEKNCCLACGAEFPVAYVVCPACGWSYVSSDVDLSLSETRATQERSEFAEDTYHGWSETLRGMKRTFVWCVLVPVIAGFLFAVYGVMMIVESWLTNSR